MLFYGLTLLLWKNFILIRRKWVFTTVAIILPCLPLLGMLYFKNMTKIEKKREPAVLFREVFPVTALSIMASVSNAKLYTIVFTPETKNTRIIMEMVKENLLADKKPIPQIELKSFPTEEEVEKHFLKATKQVQQATICAIVFTVLKGKKLEYKIRFPPKLDGEFFTDWKTEETVRQRDTPGPRDAATGYGLKPPYFFDGFIRMQYVVDSAIIAFLRNIDTNFKDQLNASIFVRPHFKRMPFPPYVRDDTIPFLSKMLPILFVTAFMICVVDISRSVVYEKEKRLKESLRIMGISSLTHWLAWFLTYFLLMSISIGIMLIVLCVKLIKYGKLLDLTSPLVLFVFLELYLITVITFTFCVCVSFNSASSAASAVGFAFFMSFLPYLFIKDKKNDYLLTAMSFIPNVGMSFGIKAICFHELMNKKMDFSQLTSSHKPDLQTIFYLFSGSSVFCLLATFYQEQVWPGEWGVPQPWYFPIKILFSLFKSKQKEEIVPNIDISMEDKKFFEEQPPNVTSGVQIRNLRKVFRRGGKERIAVNNLSMNMYEGNVTVLLGHNGAGKTTTMSMITGFISPSSGTAYILGYDLRTQLHEIRKNLGLCPQYDILFDNLTVEEHMRLFGMLKGLRGSELAMEVNDRLKSVSLLHKKKAQSKTLSGGMKRRLSIAMALVGGSKIVILDEPTSGLDPHARREMWTLLQKERANRTMLLTTHFMDEAEVLGDYIGIMANGKLLCYGTPLFLKDCYGSEYRLTLVKGAGFKKEAVVKLIKSYVNVYSIESDVSDELTFSLPTTESAKFPELFEQLEKGLSAMGISSFGASITTIEQVFLKSEDYHDNTHEEKEDTTKPATEINAGELDQSNTPNNNANNPVLKPTHSPLVQLDNFDNRKRIESTVTGLTLFFRQFIYLVRKRILHFKEHIFTIVLLICCPPVFLTVTFFLVKMLRYTDVSKPARYMDLSGYKNVIFPFSTTNLTLSVKILNDIFQAFMRQVDGVVGIHLVNNGDKPLEDRIVKLGELNIETFTNQIVIGAEFYLYELNSQQVVGVRGYFNHESYHSLGIMVNMITNAMMSVAGLPDYSIRTINHPLPSYSQGMTDTDTMETIFIALLPGFSLILSVSFLVCSYSAQIIQERVSKTKQMHFLSGCGSAAYWLSHFLCDFINFLISSLLIMLVLWSLNEKAFVEDGRLVYVFALLMCFAFSGIPLVYIASYLFSAPSSGCRWLTNISFMSGMVMFLFVNLFTMPKMITHETGRMFEVLSYIFLPQMTLAQGFYYIYLNYGYITLCESPFLKRMCAENFINGCCKRCKPIDCFPRTNDYLDIKPNGIGKPLIFLGLQAIVFWALMFILETSMFEMIVSKIMCKGKVTLDQTSSIDNKYVPDNDVEDEHERVNQENIDELKNKDCLILKNVCKIFGSFRAVENATCSIPHGQCFGLLGTNGAGKTTTFNMMSGELRPTFGEIYINGYNLETEYNQARQCLGYCPQAHVLIDELSAREQLTLYCNLHGLDPTLIPNEVNRLMDLLNLTQYADEPCGKYSGGNKRKLNTAIALVGNPPLVLMDEPTSGMDPGARRHLWNTLTKYKTLGNTLVLTSHSMEECEALCTRVVIMVNGRYKCLGSIQHLKNKFAAGYTVLVQVPYTNDEEGQTNVQGLLKFLTKTANDFEIKDERQGYLHFHFNQTPNLTWSSLFGLFEKNRQKLNIVHYSVSQATLEEVFLGFAKGQIPPQDDKPSCKEKVISSIKSTVRRRKNGNNETAVPEGQIMDKHLYSMYTSVNSVNLSSASV